MTQFALCETCHTPILFTREIVYGTLTATCRCGLKQLKRVNAPQRSRAHLAKVCSWCAAKPGRILTNFGLFCSEACKAHDYADRKERTVAGNRRGGKHPRRASP